MTPAHTELNELIEKLEKATGPNFALDCAIYETMLPEEWFGCKVESWFGHGTGEYGCNTADGGRHLRCLRAHNFTASIDAALTLVPPSHDWSLFVDNGEAIAGVMPASEDGCDCADCHGATPAIALCIAALRARSAIKFRAALGEKA